VGVARRDISHETFRDQMREVIREDEPHLTDEQWQEFGRLITYEQVDLADPEQFDRLKRNVEQREQELGLSGNRIVYLAVTPHLFRPSIEALDDAGMIPRGPDKERLRVVIEKPFGHDLASAQELTASLSRLLSEQQIYRIDHYLG